MPKFRIVKGHDGWIKYETIIEAASLEEATEKMSWKTERNVLEWTECGTDEFDHNEVLSVEPLDEEDDPEAEDYGVYQIDVRIVATAYVKAKSAAEARKKAEEEFKDACLMLGDDTEQYGDVTVSGLPYDSPTLPDVSLSPAMTVQGLVEGWPEFTEGLDQPEEEEADAA